MAAAFLRKGCICQYSTTAQQFSCSKTEGTGFIPAFFLRQKSQKVSNNLNAYCPPKCSNPTRCPLLLPPAQSQPPWSGDIRHQVLRNNSQGQFSFLRGHDAALALCSIISTELFPSCCLCVLVLPYGLLPSQAPKREDADSSLFFCYTMPF